MTWHFTPARRRRTRHATSLASGLGLIAGLLAVGVVATTRPADAAVSSSEQWITAVSGADATRSSSLTFGTSGVTALLGARAAGCGAANAASYADLISRNAQAFLSPDVPQNAAGLQQCSSNRAATTRSVSLSKPVLSPKLHVNNLDASTLTLGGGVTISQVSGNVASQVVGGNQIVPAVNQGTASCSDTVSDNNPICASYRLSLGTGPVKNFTMTNTSKNVGNDGWYWTMSFHVATLTKAFGADVAGPGRTTPLTFSIANPADEGAVDLSGMNFSDTLPTGMTLADETTSDNGRCGTPAVNDGSPAAGDASVAVTGMDVKAGDTCTITVNVTAGVGTYTNGNSNITTNVGNLVPDTTDTLTVEEPELAVDKSSDATSRTRVGDTVTYTVKATNTGSVDYTEDEPAVLLDDLSDVLDDATYNGDAAAEIGDAAASAPGYESPVVSWSGPLAKGASVELTYSVTLKPGGDGMVDNVAFAPTCDATDPTCQTPPATPACGQDPQVACANLAVPRLTIAKSADRTSLPRDGGRVAYTVTVTNEGPGDYTADAPAAVEDDLADVLDDATFDDDSLTATAGAATRTGPSLEWSGPLAAGQSTVITYSVVYDARKTGGDRSLRNSACIADESQVLTGEPACAVADVPGAALQTWKTSDHANGAAVRVGDQITYTLHFRNDGKAPATVDEVDDLSDVLDDATVTTAPAAGDGDLAPVRTDGQLAITGTVPAGDTSTVTYTVTVKAFAEQGDHTIVNVLGADTSCADDPQMCTRHGVSHLTVDKTSSATSATRQGDEVTYTVRVENDGAGDFTVEQPATMSDDLAEVLDDARWNADLDPDAGAAVLTGSRLDWSGPLPAGESATITYSVTLTNAGDHAVRNTACVPQPGAQPSCDHTELLLPRLEASKSVEPSSGSVVKAGGELTYTLRFSNAGTAAARVARDDVAAGVLDDAQLVTPPTSSDSDVTVSPIEDGRFSVGGVLAPGRTALVTYTVKVRAEDQRGDSRLDNFMVGRGETVPSTCEPAAESVDCTTNTIAEMHDWKTADPAAGTVVKAGQRLTYTLHFRNSGTAPVTVDRVDDMVHVVDDAAIVAVPASSDPSIDVTGIDGAFSMRGTVQPGRTVTVTYGVEVKQPADQGDHVLANYLLDVGQSAPKKPVCDVGPEVDCTVNPVSDIVATKSVDPGTGTDVEPGDRLTYSLTFTNSGEVASRVDHVDHMAGMLDDADLVRGPTTSGRALTVTTRRDELVVAGDLPPGRTETVRYSVEVKDYPDQGDHRLENFLAPAGLAAADGCDPDSSTCTENSAVEPDDDSLLPDTGGPGLWLLLGGIGLLVGGGAAVVAGRRRPRP